MSGIREAEVTLENEIGRRIRCDVRLPEGSGPFPVVVILHGFKGFRRWGMFPPTARSLAGAGFATIALDTSRNGVAESPEEFTELEEFARNTPEREVRDVIRVLDAVESGELASAAGADPALAPGADLALAPGADLATVLDPSRIGIVGHSRGGGVVLLVAARDSRVKCVVTWAGVSRFHRWTGRAAEAWRRDGRIDIPNTRTGQILWLDVAVLDDLEANAEAYDLERACARIGFPALVVHGELDEAVPVAEADRILGWLASRAKKVVRVPKAGHTFGAVHPWAGPTAAWETAVEETRAWLARFLS